MAVTMALAGTFYLSKYGYTLSPCSRLRPSAVAQVFHTVLAHGPVSRAEVGRRTGLSPGAVTKAATPLLEDDWIEEIGPPTGERAAGRPATLLTVRAQRAGFLGVKVTAEELFGVRTDLTARPLATRRAELDSQDVGSVVLAIGKLVRRLTSGQAAARRAGGRAAWAWRYRGTSTGTPAWCIAPRS